MVKCESPLRNSSPTPPLVFYSDLVSYAGELVVGSRFTSSLCLRLYWFSSLIKNQHVQIPAIRHG